MPILPADSHLYKTRRSQPVSDSLDEQLIKMPDLQELYSAIPIQLSELVARLDAQTTRTFYDTMVIEQANREYVYSWTGCETHVPNTARKLSFIISEYGSKQAASLSGEYTHTVHVLLRMCP